MRPISHEKMTNLGKSCITMTDLMEFFYEKTELSDVICEECTLSRITTRKSKFEKTIITEITNATKNTSSKIQF